MFTKVHNKKKVKLKSH